MKRLALILLLFAAPVYAQPPHEPARGAIFDEEGLFKRLEARFDEKRKAEEKETSKQVEKMEFDADGNVTSEKKGFAALALAGIIAVIVKKIIMAMLWAYVIHTLMGYWWVLAIFFAAVFFVSFIGGRIGGRTVR